MPKTRVGLVSKLGQSSRSSNNKLPPKMTHKPILSGVDITCNVVTLSAESYMKFSPSTSTPFRWWSITYWGCWRLGYGDKRHVSLARLFELPKSPIVAVSLIVANNNRWALLSLNIWNSYTQFVWQNHHHPSQQLWLCYSHWGKSVIHFSGKYWDPDFDPKIWFWRFLNIFVRFFWIFKIWFSGIFHQWLAPVW